MLALRNHLLPSHQRRTLEELSDELELRSGDARAKLSAFWTMLTLSAVIASAGVLGDSTATVIGAMIIAPLSTPIMGIALAAVKRRSNGSVALVFFGAAAVVAVGAVFSLALPSSYDLLGNSQISSRVSPNLIDLVAALATGLAGAVALARRDVAAVLPGVAIAISLVPPLAVVGVCIGQGAANLAFGALMLFVSNLISLVLAGMFIFTVLGYTSEVFASSPRRPTKTYLTIGVLSTVVLVFLGANTVLTYLVSSWEGTIRHAAEDWLDETGTKGATVDSVDLHVTTFDIRITSIDELPSTDQLLSTLEGDLPDGLSVKITDTKGQTIEVGTIGSEG